MNDQPTIPADVYWNRDASNFYSFTTLAGMGDVFFRTWQGRKAEFPTGPQAPNWCAHYRTPMQHDTCHAGVAYDTFRDVPFDRRPCYLTEHADSKPGAVTCTKLRRPSSAEIAMWRAHFGQSMDRLAQVLVATTTWREKHLGENAKEVLECPICHGRLHVTISGRKGSMMGACETPDCIKWIE